MELDKQVPLDVAGMMLREKLNLKKHYTWADAIAAALVRRAIHDNDAAREAVDWLEGNPSTPVELSTAKDIRFHVVYDGERPSKD